MTDSETVSIIELQNRIRIRLAELGFLSGATSSNIERHLAHVGILSRNFAAQTLPLFLTVSPDHADSIAQLITSIKCDLDELRDAITDLEPDLILLMEFLNRG
jgi:hypothetical protein